MKRLILVIVIFLITSISYSQVQYDSLKALDSCKRFKTDGTMYFGKIIVKSSGSRIDSLKCFAYSNKSTLYPVLLVNLYTGILDTVAVIPANCTGLAFGIQIPYPNDFLLKWINVVYSTTQVDYIEVNRHQGFR